MNTNKAEIYNKIVEFLKSKGATKVAVFGSYVRNEETPESDIDVIVEFIDKPSLLEFVKLERILSENIGVKVDLMSEKGISPLLINRIKNQMKILYQ
jgi:predicted nucleotidyltransferase